MHGYHFGISDQGIITPFIFKILDSSLFNSDPLFIQPSAYVSIFYYAVGFVLRFADIQTIFFLGYLIAHFIFFLAIHRLATRILNNKNLAYLALFPFVLPKFIGGTAAFTYDIYFSYRSIGVIILIFYLTYLFERKFIVSSAIAAIGLWIHPTSIFPNIANIYFFIFNFSKKKLHDLILITFIFTISLFIIFIFISSNFQYTSLNSLSDNWLNIIKTRDSYLFLSQWHLRGWLSLFLYITLVLLFSKQVNRTTRKFIFIIVGSSLFILVLNYLVLDIIKLPYFAQFQLAKSITPVAFIGLILSPFFLMSKNYIQKLIGIIAFIALSLNIFSVLLIAVLLYFLSVISIKANFSKDVSSGFIFTIFMSLLILQVILNYKTYQNLNQLIQYPKKIDDWIVIQLWARNNSNKDEIFLTPANLTGFRIFSQRQIVGDIKDGALVAYSPTFARQWSERMKDLQNFEKFIESDFLILKEKYHFSYVITPSSQVLDFEIIYKNNSYIIYKL